MKQHAMRLEGWCDVFVIGGEVDAVNCWQIVWKQVWVNVVLINGNAVLSSTQRLATTITSRY